MRKTTLLALAMSVTCVCEPISGKETRKTFRLRPVVEATVTTRRSELGRLASFGVPWSDYSRVLLKFSLLQISPVEFGRVKRATLKLTVKHAETQDAEHTLLLPMETDWSENVSWSSPDGKETSWKSRRGWANIDYSGDEDRQVSAEIPNGGEILIDVTRIVDAWLYQGVPNYGLMIKTGKTIAGRPNAGKWTIEFASSNDKTGAPALLVEMEKKVTPKVLNRYPSAFLSPIRQPYLFVWYQSMPSFPGMAANVAAPVADTNPGSGILPLGWWYGPQNPYRKSEKAIIKVYEQAARSTSLGFAVDEWQPLSDNEKSPCYRENPYGIAGSIKGMVRAEKIAPEKFWAVYWRGEKTIEPLVKQNAPDLLIIEGYTHVPKTFPRHFAISIKGTMRRIDYARSLGVIEKTIVMLGHLEKKDTYYPDHVLTSEELIQQIKEIHDYAPEMPGIGFYHANSQSLAKTADDACRKVYVDPAPKVEIVRPRFQQQINTMHVELLAKAVCKKNRKVALYRWFVDNREVGRTKAPYYILDVRNESPGLHIVTVHAIDTGWYRASRQIPVFVEKPKRMEE